MAFHHRFAAGILSGNNLMKIGMVNTKFGFWGGVERYIFQTAEVFHKSGHTISGLFEEKTDKTEGFSSPFDFFTILDDKNQVDDSLIQNLNWDVVFLHKIAFIHDHDYYCPRHHKYYLYKRKNCHRRFHPVVCSICMGMMQKSGGKIPFKPVKMRTFNNTLSVLKKASGFVVLSDFMRQNLIINGFEEAKIHIIHPFVQGEQKIVPKENEIPTLLYVGQLIRGKGVDLLIQALSFLSKPFHLFIVGSGNDETYLKRLTGLLGLEKYVTFTGWQSDVEQFYQKADLLVVPSRWQEPFGLIGIEAFRHHLPVVAFDTGGISEWLEHDKNGSLAPENDVKKLAEQINVLISDKAKMQKFGKNGFQKVKQDYSEENFNKNITKLIKNFER
jgi:glycosyltransferase involved in cell wall biosynthesis